MKIIKTAMAAVLACMCLTSCGGKEEKPAMYIEEAVLTKQEENMVTLLGVGSGVHKIYDFKLDDTVRTMECNVYELVDGSWEVISGSSQQLTDKEGRLAFSYEAISRGVRLAFLGENSSGAGSYVTEEGADTEGMARISSNMGGRKEVVYDTEIPVSIEVHSTQSAITAYNVDSYFTPEKYQKLGYEHVYAVTVCFSQKDIEQK